MITVYGSADWPDPPRDLIPVNARKLDIHKDQVRYLCLRRRQSFLACQPPQSIHSQRL